MKCFICGRDVEAFSHVSFHERHLENGDVRFASYPDCNIISDQIDVSFFPLDTGDEGDY